MKKLLLPLMSLFTFSVCLAQSGGPDAFGYTWEDHTATNGPTYNWIDITAIGDTVNNLGDDNSVGPFPIGFNFTYYWTAQTDFHVGSNGYIVLGPHGNGNNTISSGATGFPLIPTSTDVQHNFLAPLLTDLRLDCPGGQGDVVYWSNNVDTLIVSFIDVAFWNQISNCDGSNTFQVILNGADNSITYQYMSQSGFFDPAYNTAANPVVVGIENITGTIGLEVSNNPLPTAPRAVRFAYPDTVLFSVVDVKPNYINNTGNGGFFAVANTPSVVNGSVSSVGNAPVPSAFDVETEIFVSNAGVPTGGAFYSETFSIGGINIGQTVDYTYGPTFSGGAGIYHVITETQLATDLVTGNNQIETELIVLDTVGATQAVLGYTDNTLEQLFGFEGAAVHYEPPFYPTDVEQIAFWCQDGDTTMPSNQIVVRIWEDNNGQPGTLLSDDTIAPASVVTITDGGGAGAPTILTLPTPVTITSGGFFVSWQITTANQNTNLVTDITGPFSNRTYEVLSGVFAPYRNAGIEDIFLTAVVSITQNNTVTPPVADFSASTFTACTGESIDFFNLALTATTTEWTFESGSPASATSPTPTVSWGSVGTWDVTLIASNSAGADTITKQMEILVSPASGFTVPVDTAFVGEDVTFTNTSTNSNSNTWQFGDGSSSFAVDATYAYPLAGTYTVTLHAANSCGTDSATSTIVVVDTPTTGTGLANIKFENEGISIFPNPTNGMVTVELSGAINYDKLELYTLKGDLLKTEEVVVSNGHVNINMEGFEPGVYVVKATGDNRVATRKITLIK